MDQVFEISDEPGEIRGVEVVKVAGEVDVATSPALRDKLSSSEPGGVLVVDLLDVTFLDSTGLGVLVGALKRRREHGGTIRLVIEEPRIIRIFEITGLTGVFPIYGSLDAAVED